VELYAQNEKETHSSLGIYSVLQDKWLKEPKEEKGQVDEKAVENKASHLMAEIDAAIDEQNVETLRTISEKIRVMRTAGLHENGEYSVENQTFKKLRRNGYMEKLSKAKIALTEKMLSLNNKTAISTFPESDILKLFQYLKSSGYYIPDEAFVLTDEERADGIETVAEKLELEYVTSRNGQTYTVTLDGKDITVFMDHKVGEFVDDIVLGMDEKVVRHNYIDMLLDVFKTYDGVLEQFGYEVSKPGEYTIVEVKK
jgi:hypothetical protein